LRQEVLMLVACRGELEHSDPRTPFAGVTVSPFAHNCRSHVRRSGVLSMRRVAVTLAMSFVVAGCGQLPQPYPTDSAMAHMIGDAGGWTTCPGGAPADVWVTGVIAPDADGFAGIKDDQGVFHPLVWGSGNTATVEWGRRYRIGGIWFNEPPTLWTCAGASAVIPQ
jgi:hypothetical protein